MGRFREALHKKMRPLCDEVGPGDGRDPRYDCNDHKPVANRKAMQLASQVFETLSVAIPNMSDEVLQNLSVDSVNLAPDSSRMLVTVASNGDESQVLSKLETAKGKLRSEIARSINRRKTPDLVFRVKKAELEKDEIGDKG